MGNELIILPCHSIWRGGSTLGKSKEEWFLASFQLEGEDHLCFCDHIKTSFEILRKKPNAILVISGGQTKAEAGFISESQSYINLLKRMFPDALHDFSRVIAEEYARDSFENVIFSICRYYEVSGNYPSHITIVGFEFKRERFLTCHLTRALSYPEEHVTYVGNHPSPKDQHKVHAYFEDLKNSERKYALAPFTEDPYGLRSPLRTKRMQRDPFQRQHEYHKSNPDLADFLDCIKDTSHCNDDTKIRSTIKFDWEF